MTVKQRTMSTAAEGLIQGLADAGVDTIFANPGTTEMPLVAALDTCGRKLKPVLALHENVCSAAADGYWRTRGMPAATILHLGPGLTNAAANLHNAMKARSGIVNIIGDHPTRHLSFGSPLQTPLEGLARNLSDWTGFVSDAAETGAIAYAAAQIAMTGKVATLIAPHDVQLKAMEAPQTRSLGRPKRPRSSTVSDVALVLERAKRPAIYLGGDALREDALRLAAKLGSATGASLFCETLFSAMDRGGDVPGPTRLAYFPEHAVAQLAAHDVLVLVGAPEPVAFFAYPSMPSRLVPETCEVVTLATPQEDCATAIAELLDLLPQSCHATKVGRPTLVSEPVSHSHGDALTAASLCDAVSLAIPENGVVVDEAITTGLTFYAAAARARRLRHLCLTGGAIGWGPGAAVGAAIGSDGPVINLQADGSGLYLPQALWTQARQGLAVTTVICSNSKYRILETELTRGGFPADGGHSAAMCDLDGVDWCTIARGFGVDAIAVRTYGELAAALEGAAQHGGPFLIEAAI